MIKTFVISCFLSVVLASDDCPQILEKGSWIPKGASSAGTPNIKKNLPYVIIHHTVTPSCVKNACIQQLRSMRADHVDKGWGNEIGYHFLIDEAGNIFEGRGWGKRGVHAKGYNPNSLGIAVMGNFMNKKPSRASLNSIQKLIDCGVSKEYIASDYKLLGHRQTKATLCPGDELYKEISQWQHWSKKP